MALRGPKDQDYVLETGAAVQDVREAARLTQDELAELVGVSKQTISNIERAYLDGVNVLRVRQIASVCAGRGWLPKDADALSEYILGSRTSLPAAMQRRSVPDPQPPDRIPDSERAAGASPHSTRPSGHLRIAA